MNREQRRKSGISKETSDKLEGLKQPCTVLECVQLSQGVADDKIREYHETINPVIVSLSLQLETLKELLFKPIPISDTISKEPYISEEDFVSLFNSKLEDYNKMKEEAIKAIQEQVDSAQSNVHPKTDFIADDLEVEVEKK